MYKVLMLFLLLLLLLPLLSDDVYISRFSLLPTTPKNLSNWEHSVDDIVVIALYKMYDLEEATKMWSNEISKHMTSPKKGAHALSP